jgi:filamentous hemagglutinin family protein
MKLFSLASVLAIACPQLAHAQSTTIVPDVSPGLSLGTTVDRGGNTYTIDGGKTAGTNLFHSFSTFDIGAGDVARWTYSAGNPATITNVVNRVTGGSASSILGVLDSTAIPNADFYFINPAGIVFNGPSAQVNVPAAAHFSTASELKFGNGDVFKIATSSGSTLSVAAPQAFGFLGNEGDLSAGTIENVDKAFLAAAGRLSLSAANIDFDNVLIGSNDLSITAVGAIPLTLGLDGTMSADPTGRVQLVGGALQTWPGDCYENCLGVQGRITIQGGDLLLSSTGIAASSPPSTTAAHTCG